MIRTLTVAFALILAFPAAAVEKLLAPPAAGPALLAPPADVVGWLQPLAGSTGIACGTHSLANRESPALACAADAIRQSKPFWIVFEEVGADNGSWTGMVRNADGKAWSVRFDHGSKLAHMSRPQSVTVLSCTGLAVEGTGVLCIEP